MESSATTALAPRAATDVTKTASDAFDADKRELIRSQIAPDLTEPEFDLFLELAAGYQLNPLNQEIYAAKMPGRNGEPGKLTPIVGKHGHLAIAQRYPDFEGIEADVVREKDVFRVLRPEPGVIHVQHEYEGGGKGDEEGDAAKERGKIVGAWALVHRRGRKPSYFYAPWGEYAPSQLRRAWQTHPSAMIRKCALVNALREQFSLSGLYFEGELDRVMEQGQAPGPPAEPEWGDDPAVAARLRQLVDAVNGVRPGAYRPAKLRPILATAGDDGRRALIETLERELRAAGADVPEPSLEAEAVEDVPDEGPGVPDPTAAEPGVQDAVVVEGGEAENELADIDLALDEGVDDDAERAQLQARRAELLKALGQGNLL